MDRVDLEIAGLCALCVVHIVATIIIGVATWIFFHNFSWCRFGYLTSSIVFMMLSLEEIDNERLGGAVFSMVLSIVFALVVIYGL